MYFIQTLIYEQNNYMILHNYTDKLFIEINEKDIKYFHENLHDIKHLLIRNLGKNCQFLPSAIIQGMHNLQTLSLYKVNFLDYDCFQLLKSLKYLEFSHMKILDIPLELKFLTEIKELTIRHSEVSNIDMEWSYLEQLEHLNLESNQIQNIPPSFYWHKNLKSVSFAGNPIESIDFNFDNELSKLEYLYLGETNLKKLSFPSNLLPALKQLYLNDTKLVELPNSILELENLEELYLMENDFSHTKVISSTINSSISYINLSFCELQEVPKWIKSFDLSFELILEDNPIKELPNWLGKLPYLTCIHLKGTLITDKQIEDFKSTYPNKKWIIME